MGVHTGRRLVMVIDLNGCDSKHGTAELLIQYKNVEDARQPHSIVSG
jgi:hypothetical protein